MLSLGVCRYCGNTFEYERLGKNTQKYCSSVCRNKINNDKEFKERYYLSPTKIWVRDYKSTHPCTDCKSLYPWYIMEFDHTSDDKVKKISQLSNQSMEIVLKEIEKCDLVCVNCHRVRTYKRNHGLEWRVNL